METDLIEPEELAKRWKITTTTLAQWRWSGRGPRYVRLGHNSFYRPKDIEAYEEEKARRSTTKGIDEDRFAVILENRVKNRRRRKK
ncbi:MAG: DNA-binding protein [Alphaproteobacteria bacterium]|nr:DNA-binding protein [Alphaproteobacteria bacterium]